MVPTRVNAAKFETQKPSTCRATLFRCKYLSMFPVFHLVWSTCRATKHLLRIEENFGFVARFSSNSLVGQQICSCPSKSTNQRAAFLQPATNVFLRVKLIKQGEKRETSTKTCNETMLRDKLEGFCISYFASLMHASFMRFRFSSTPKRLKTLLKSNNFENGFRSGAFWKRSISNVNCWKRKHT